MKSMERMKPEMKKGMNPDVSIGLIAIGSRAWFDCCWTCSVNRRKRNEYL